LGNCGFGVAPTRPAHRDLVLRTLEKVEGMSLDALRAGIGREWPFETFGEFLDAIARRGTAINIGALVGHTPVRLWVMGEEATEREATDDEIAAMRTLVAEALAAGAVGFATSKSPTHVGFEGRPVPSRAASLAEIEALAGCLADTTSGVMQATLGPGLFLDEFAAIQQRTGRPISWTALLGGMLGPDGHRAVLEQSAALQARGVRVIPQVSCRPLMIEFDLAAPFPLESMSVMQPVSRADREGKKRIYADPEFRRVLRERLDGGRMIGRFRDMEITHHPADPALAERRLGAVAAERGVHPIDLALDLSLASDLETRFRLAVLNTDEAVVAELLRHPATMIGLSDAGAHASQLCDACAPTELLGKWVRERPYSARGGVRRLTSRPPTSSASPTAAACAVWPPTSRSSTRRRSAARPPPVRDFRRRRPARVGRPRDPRGDGERRRDPRGRDAVDAGVRCRGRCCAGAWRRPERGRTRRAGEAPSSFTANDRITTLPSGEPGPPTSGTRVESSKSRRCTAGVVLGRAAAQDRRPPADRLTIPRRGAGSTTCGQDSHRTGECDHVCIRWKWKPAGSGIESDVIPVTPAQAWLLTIGWRRHGLIDPVEVPGALARAKARS
jgi:hypothetical protein